MALSREQFAKLRAKGLTPEQIARFESGEVPGAGGGGAVVSLYPNLDQAPVPEVGGVSVSARRGLVRDPMARQIIRRVGAGLTGAGMLAGGVTGMGVGGAAGGIGAVPGAALGGATGGAGGRFLENLSNRYLLGDEPQPGILESLGTPIPAAAREPVDIAEQAALGAGGEALPTWLFGAPGRSAGAIGEAAGGISTRMRTKAAEKAVEKVRRLRAAGDIGGETQAAEAAARTARQTAGRKLGKALERPGAVTVSDIAGDIAAQQKATFKSSVPAKRLAEVIRKRLQEVLPEETTGVISGKQEIYNLPMAHRAQRIFDTLARSDYSATRRGLTPNASLDRMIADAFRKRLADIAPEVGPLKKEAQRAIREHQDIVKETNRARTDPVQGLRNLKQERVAAESARLPGEGVHLGFGLRGPEVRSPRLADAAAMVERALARPGVAGTLRYTPDILNILSRFAMASEPDVLSTEAQ